MLTCKHCEGNLFIELKVGQFLDNPQWLERGLPLAKKDVDEWTLGGNVIYKCFRCGEYANSPRTNVKTRKSNMAQ